jgi:hypothetical protein
VNARHGESLSISFASRNLFERRRRENYVGHARCGFGNGVGFLPWLGVAYPRGDKADPNEGEPNTR